MNEYDKITSIAIRRPQAAFISQQVLTDQWQALNYHAEPDYKKAIIEYNVFVAVLGQHGAQIIELDAMTPPGLDSIYVRDSLITSPKGIITAAMGKSARASEPAQNAAMLKQAGEKIIGQITAPGSIEGGDLVWLDDKTLLAAIGYRTNVEGVRQLQEILGDQINIEAFDMPHYKGAADVFHLMSVLSPVDKDLAVVYLPLMPVRLVQFLTARDISFVEVPEFEFDSMACNVLAIAPRHVVMVSGNPVTTERLEKSGCKVEVIKAQEISRKGEGGPTCLTRPLARS